MFGKNITKSLWITLCCFVLLSLFVTACQPAPQPVATEQAEPEATEAVDEQPASDSTSQSGLPAIDTFETDSLPSGLDGSAQIGFLTWSDGSPVVIEPVVVESDAELARPDQMSQNTVIRLDTTIGSGGWAGFTHAFEDVTGEKWTHQNWEEISKV